MGFLLHVGATVQCPHGAAVTIVSGNAKVLAGGQPAAVLGDKGTVAGCPFQIPVGPGTKPQPCVAAQWVVGAAKVLIGGQPALLQESSGICRSAEQIPQGPPNVTATQMKVKGG